MVRLYKCEYPNHIIHLIRGLQSRLHLRASTGLDAQANVLEGTSSLNQIQSELESEGRVSPGGRAGLILNNSWMVLVSVFVSLVSHVSYWSALC